MVKEEQSAQTVEKYSRVNELRNLSFGSQKRFSHKEISYNARMTNLQAVAYAQYLIYLKL